MQGGNRRRSGRRWGQKAGGKGTVGCPAGRARRSNFVPRGFEHRCPSFDDGASILGAGASRFDPRGGGGARSRRRCALACSNR
eukprot:7325895-Pyramimonas_sp.AAC.1